MVWLTTATVKSGGNRGSGGKLEDCSESIKNAVADILAKDWLIGGDGQMERLDIALKTCASIGGAAACYLFGGGPLCWGYCLLLS